jgi:hypothetical protein
VLAGAGVLYFQSHVCYIATMRWTWAALFLGVDTALLVALPTFGHEQGGRVGIGLLAVMVLVQPLFGFAVGSYWALLLPLAPAFGALPAGTPDGGEMSLAAWLMLLGIFQCVLLVPGIVARQVRDAPSCDEGSLGEST